MAANNNKHAIVPDLTRSFDKAGWVPLWETHHEDFNLARIIFYASKLAVTLEDEEITFEENQAEDAYAYLTANSDAFTIAEFLPCLKIASNAAQKLMAILHTTAADEHKDVLLRASEAKRVALEKSVADMQRRINDIPQSSAQHPNVEQLKVPDLNLNFTNANQPLLSNHGSVNNDPQVGPKSGFHSPNIQPRQHNNETDYRFNQMAEAIQILAQATRTGLSSSGGRRTKITKNPELYNQREHSSLLSFGACEYARWAEGQGISEMESTIYFCHSFQKKLHIDQVSKISKNSDGSPRFNTIAELIQTIIAELRYDEESINRLQQKFINSAVNSKNDLDYEFLRIYNLRRQGWILENEPDVLEASKTQFIRGLDLQNHLHGLIFSASNQDAWINTGNCTQITTQLRTLEIRFKQPKRHALSNTSNSKPTNNRGIDDMCDNIESAAAPPSNGDEFSRSEPTQSAEMNNVTRKCQNAKCGKPFSPAQPNYKCCSVACAKEYRIANPRRGGGGGKPKEKAYKRANNMEACNATTTPGVSLKGRRYYMTPAHIYTNDSDIPTIIHDSLFDTGAGPTICTLDVLRKHNLHKQIVYEPGNEILGGDSRPMKGYVGYVKLNLALEDTTVYITDTFVMKVLVFNRLNHDFIIGQDSMNHITFQGYPRLNTLLLNPSLKKTASFNKKLRDFVRLNNSPNSKSSSKCLNVESSDVMSGFHDATSRSVPKIPKCQFNEKETFLLHVPKSKFSVNNFSLFSEQLDYCCNNFMEVVEKNDSPLADILTQGGLDGVIDNRAIEVSDTKILKTNKGDFSVGDQMSDVMSKKFAKYIDEFKGNVFDCTVLGRTKQVCHPTIDPLAPAPSQASRYMPLNPFLQKEAKSLVDRMVKLGVLEVCTEVANSTIFVVQKTSGKWRLICDLKKFNERLTNYIVHLPSPYELINKICGSKLFSYCDFPDAYFQVPLSDESIKNSPIVASVSGCNTNFKFLRMAQGLRPATATFVNITNEVYSEISDDVSNYLDDSVVGTVDDEEIHFAKLRRFIEITNDAGLKLSQAKCVFFAKNITFLNYTITNGKWSLSDKQKSTINSLNADNLNIEKRESLAAFLQHFNRFTTGVSHAARKIRDQTLSDEAIKSVLEAVKTKLINSKALKSVDFKSELHIYVDASQSDVSGCIYQKTKGTGMELVTCFSKKLPKPMLAKGIYEKELFALQQLVKTYRYLLIGEHKKVFWTDNRAVLAADKSRAPSLKCLFDFIRASFGNVRFNFVPTKQNPADIFTRQPASSDSASDCGSDFNKLSVSEQVKLVNSIAAGKPKRDCVKLSKKTMDRHRKDKILSLHVKGGCVSAGRLLTTFKSIPDFAEVSKEEIETVLNECETCQHISNHVKPRKSAPGVTLSRELSTMDSVYIDHKKIISKVRSDHMDDQNDQNDENAESFSGNKTCLTIFEPVSQMTFCYPVMGYDTSTVKACLRLFFQANGVPGSVIADNAKSFTALKPWLEKEFGCALHHTSAYHPCSNLSERCHREFERVLRKFNSDSGKFNFEDWEDAICKCVIAMNTLKHSTYGLSPYEIFKNRIIQDLEPLRFSPTPFEYQLKSNRFVKKADAVVNSKLKQRLPVFIKDSVVKVAIPEEPIRFGTITAYKDSPFNKAVKMKFPNPDHQGKFLKPIAISKDFICIPANSAPTQ